MNITILGNQTNIRIARHLDALRVTVLDGKVYYDGENYDNDLNAMHKAVETLRHRDGSEWWDFQHALARICGSTGNCIQATAAQRAEAFLETME